MINNKEVCSFVTSITGAERYCGLQSRLVLCEDVSEEECTRTQLAYEKAWLINAKAGITLMRYEDESISEYEQRLNLIYQDFGL